MSRFYGSPGKGALDKIVDDIYLAENPPEESSGARIGSFRGCLLTIFGSYVLVLIANWVASSDLRMPGWIPLIVIFIIVGYFLLRKPLGKLLKRAPESVEARRTREEIDTDIWNAFSQYRSGTPIEHTAIPDSARNWAIGALTEMRVAGILDRELPLDNIVMNDVDIAHGKYNIDHLVLTRVGAVQVDSKSWSKPVPVIPSPPPSVIYERHANPHWLQWTGNHEDADPAMLWDMDENGSMVLPGSYQSSAVGTCMFEASHLPGRPIALVFAVDGEAEASLPYGGLRVSHYSTTATRNSPNEIRRSPFPIVFCRASQVASVIRTITQPLLNVTPPGMKGPAYMSMDLILSADGVGLS